MRHANLSWANLRGARLEGIDLWDAALCGLALSAEQTVQLFQAGQDQVPVWFFWDGETFLIVSQPNKQKLRNVRQNPNVTLALDGTGNLGVDVVVVEGTAELLHEPSVSLLGATPAIAEKYDFLLKSMNADHEALAAVFSQPIRVTPTRFLVGGEMQSVSA
jgi:PPOX class probable F420-dependent enzyme